MTKLLLFLATAALAVAQPTAVPTSMIRWPAVQTISIPILTPAGLLLVQLDGVSLILDASGPTPVLRAIAGPLVQRTDTTDVYVVKDATQATFKLRGSPASGTVVKAWRNGLRMAPKLDYTLAGSVLTFVPGQIPVSGDVVLVEMVADTAVQ